MKAVQSQVAAMSDVIRAIAGAPEAKFDLIRNAIYSAAYSIMQAGNKTQFTKLESDAKLYGTGTKDANKLCKEAVGAKSLSAAAKQFGKTYFAVSVALAQMGVPEFVRDLPQGKSAEVKEQQFAVLDPLAQAYADEFVSIFMTTYELPEKTEEERAEAAQASKAKREAKAKAAAKELQQTIKTEAEKLAGAREITLEEMARMVANALHSGALDAETEAGLIEAAQMRETALLLARAASTKPETVEA